MRYSRWTSLFGLINSREKASKAKAQLFSSVVCNRDQLRLLKKVPFQFQTVAQLIKHLVTINIPQLTAMLILSLISLIFRLFCANINTYIIQLFQQEQSAINLLYCMLILVVYKITKAGIDQWSSYLQMNYGFMGYSGLYYHFLKKKTQLTGEVLNIIEDDMQKITNLPYSLVNFPFLSILIIVLTILLAINLESNVAVCVIISFLLYTINCIGGVFVFYLNEKIMKQKDYRLTLNLADSQNSDSIEQARKKQASLIKKFLLVKVVVKWLMEISFLLFYSFVFLWKSDSQLKQSDDQSYYQLMLLGMLKIASNSLFIESYYIALVLNSLKRIISCQGRSQIQNSTIGCYEDFIQTQRRTPSDSHNQNQRESTGESLFSEISANDSLIDRDSTETNNKMTIQIKEIKSIRNRKGNPAIPTKSQKKYSERGEIKIFELFKYIKKNIHASLSLLLIVLGVLTLYTKFQNLRISNSIIHDKMTAFQYFIFILPAVLYMLFYLSIIFIFGEVSQNLFRNLSSKKIEAEDLNRVSGDIQMVDKYVSPSFYEFFVTSFGLLASLILTITLIKDILFAILTAILLTMIIGLSIYLNRYFMKSRREIKRLQCKTKSLIIKQYTQVKEEGISFDKVEKYWKKINVLKNVGILIQNSNIFVLNVLVLLIQIFCFVICYAGTADKSTSKLILVFIIQLDLSLTGLLLNTIGLQMGLVSFQRCLNFVKKKTIGNKIEKASQDQNQTK